MDLKHIQELDLCCFDHRRIDLIQLLLIHTSRLCTFITNKLNPSLIIPEHIHSVILRKSSSSIYPINQNNIDKLSQSLSYIRHLEVPVASKEMIIDQFIQLKSLRLLFDSEQYSILEDISTEWFQQNTRRLKHKD
ncbi:unnamed protein product [Rotaria sordida]|uniref:Uncharacterized protein n=1 Tax=Rotaria sordida TaxID=392033 RepID=A0A814L0W6_9BILA|nr:unnamed protein product [Rotaria sordida]